MPRFLLFALIENLLAGETGKLHVFPERCQASEHLTLICYFVCRLDRKRQQQRQQNTGEFDPCDTVVEYLDPLILAAEKLD